MDYDKLLAELDKRQKNLDVIIPGNIRIDEQSATAIRKQAAEIESLRAACKGTTVSCVCGSQGEIDKLRARIAALEAAINTAQIGIEIGSYQIALDTLKETINTK